jgi:chondroitin AC lyase
MVYYSFGLGYQQNPSLRARYGPIIFNTAKSLTERFSDKVGCTMSWSPGHHCNSRSPHHDDMCNFTVIIDNMMNLEVLYFAALNVSDAHCGGCTQSERDRLLHVANSHATTTGKNHIRDDGSTHHIVNYDPKSGAVDFACAGGGYNDSSTWARGQAWAIYGFTMSYRYSRNKLFLDLAHKVADYFIRQLNARFPVDNVPAYDLSNTLVSNTDLSQRDASAATIATSGLLELARYTSNDQAKQYLKVANKMLTSLVNGQFKTDFRKTEGAVAHCNAQDTGVSWADYYLAEACQRVLGRV